MERILAGNHTELIASGLQISFEPLVSVIGNELVIKIFEESIELNYFTNSNECEPSETKVTSFLIHIKFDQSYFKNKDFSRPFHALPSHSQSICCNTQFILMDIWTTNLNGIYRKLFLESKAVELLLRAYSLHLEQSGDCANCRFLKFDYNKDKIIQARQILLENLNNPPTIPDLAKIIGINQCYLKKGFKEMFNMTIYDFVMEQRMILAKGLIQNSQFSVYEVSESLGYASSSSFSKAFKKIHGFSPSELK
ncbi:MAG: helix-turn-helix transcriptional regulator [Saprospiraceae bacterium]|nr:helix-turn-helix transcriptional regulator [Saprospiraceae bacterium]MBK9729339.1 helix-turn-helix transcriptional regulator [Saprospiraceae bacterium]